MTTPHISLAMLARSAYRPVGAQPRAEETAYEPGLPRQTVRSSPAVKIELSDAARSALLDLQEVSAGRTSGQPNPGAAAANASKAYVAPGSRLNLSI